ncbi:MAG TPA: hypothetical protein VF054_05325 [Micromonosporaceae bacterium]
MTGPVVDPEVERSEPSPREPEPREPEPREPPEWLLGLGGTVVGLLAAVVTGVVEALYAPLRIGTVRVPLSPVLAAVFNILIIWFTYRVTRRRGLALLPGLAWFAVMIAAATRTTEGDLLFTGDDWMALVTIGVGTAAWVVAAYRLITTAMRVPPRRPPGTGVR